MIGNGSPSAVDDLGLQRGIDLVEEVVRRRPRAERLEERGRRGAGGTRIWKFLRSSGVRPRRPDEVTSDESRCPQAFDTAMIGVLAICARM